MTANQVLPLLKKHTYKFYTTYFRHFPSLLHRSLQGILSCLWQNWVSSVTGECQNFSIKLADRPNATLMSIHLSCFISHVPPSYWALCTNKSIGIPHLQYSALLCRLFSFLFPRKYPTYVAPQHNTTNTRKTRARCNTVVVICWTNTL